MLSEPAGKRLRRLLTTAIRVVVKGNIDSSRGVAELPKLARIEMGSQRAGDVLKSGLPHRGIVEQPFDQYHFRIGLDSLPQVQAALSAWQKTVSWRRIRKAAAIKIAFQRKDDAAYVCVVTGIGHQTGLTQS